jgi:5'/3'-nucleotidase
VRILLTNDDGIESPGLHALAAALRAREHDLVVVAPRDDMSGVGAAIGRIRADQRIEVTRASIPGEPSVAAHALAGPPGLAVMAACLGAFGEPPDVVVTGVNAGPNTGHACLHSGTVGAALTAATFGISALATSAMVRDPMDWSIACDLIGEPLALIARLPAATVLNLNAPAAAARELRWARLDRFGRVRVALAASGDEWLQMEYRTTEAELDPECDTALLEQGYATLTAIQGIGEVAHAELAQQAPPPRAEAAVAEVPAEGDRTALQQGDGSRSS